MDSSIIVAIIAGAATLFGLIISGVFGLLANTSQREQAAAAGVERAMNERLEYKDEQLADCRKNREAAETREREALAKLNEKELQVWELKGENHALEVENRMLRGGPKE